MASAQRGVCQPAAPPSCSRLSPPRQALRSRQQPVIQPFVDIVKSCGLRKVVQGTRQAWLQEHSFCLACIVIARMQLHMADSASRAQCRQEKSLASSGAGCIGLLQEPARFLWSCRPPDASLSKFKHGMSPQIHSSWPLLKVVSVLGASLYNESLTRAGSSILGHS